MEQILEQNNYVPFDPCFAFFVLHLYILLKHSQQSKKRIDHVALKRPIFDLTIYKTGSEKSTSYRLRSLMDNVS